MELGGEGSPISMKAQQDPPAEGPGCGQCRVGMPRGGGQHHGMNPAAQGTPPWLCLPTPGRRAAVR